MKKVPPNKNSPAHHNGKAFHPDNLHNHGYDFPELIKSHTALYTYVATNKYQRLSIDFSDPIAVKVLNCALLKHYYGIVEWDVPDGYLCPPIPGRVDYIHYVAELLNVSHSGKNELVNDSSVKLLDIGTGANGIYSLLACQVYGWQCVASDIDPVSLDNVADIIRKNPALNNRLKLRLQHHKNHIFDGIIQQGDYFDVSVCNPPFHASLEDARKSSQQKRDNLAINRNANTISSASQNSPISNFGGQKAELWCKGGESKFLRMMIKESKTFGNQCRWFTSLISKSDNVQPAMKLLRKLEATDIKEIEMKQGNKITRILAWTFFSTN
ncbi:MAG: 23S rRNA (adenine(1618)-N(6))-methyltransferase RlmF [Pseudomonadota bacterium]|nr:23S rRNA (adenine(1618)-N(6))-methyltransferase RlmF [Pseudomonadota bacterium]